MRYRLGLDIGVSSCGWAVIEHDETGEPIRLKDLGVRMFDIAETPKDGSPLSKARREARSIRRRIRRRKHRIIRVKRLLVKYNILTEIEIENLYDSIDFNDNIYKLRVEALDKKIDNKNLARILIHMVKKRGYKSNVLLETDAKDEDGKVLTATKENTQLMLDNGYRTVAEMYLNDNKFKIYLPSGKVINKIRNSTGKYNSTVLRQQLREEVFLILYKQKQLNNLVTQEFIKEYLNIFDSQRDYDEGVGKKYTKLQIDKMLGKCIFEKNENRAVKASYSFEYFNLLKKLNNIIIEKTTIKNNCREVTKRKLTQQEMKKIVNLVKYQTQVRYMDIRKELNLSNYERFCNLEYKSVTEFSDVINKNAERKPKIEGFEAYNRLKHALYYVDDTLLEKLTIQELDDIGYILTVYKSNEKRIAKFAENNINVPDYAIQELLKISFIEISYLSLKAIKKLTPYLENGFSYNQAVDKVYPKIYANASNLNSQILDPIARRAISQTIKVINAVTNKYGNPDTIIVKISSEIGQSRGDREKIRKQIEENLAKTKKIKEELAALNVKQSGTNIAKYKLWKQQSEYCIYSGKKINIDSLFTDDTTIDYIIPFHMCFDDTYKNKVLVLSSEAKQKELLLPYTYINKMNRNLEEYETRVSMLVRGYGKKSRLMRSSIEKEEVISWRNRNIQDTQFIAKWLKNYIENNIKFTECEKYNTKVIITSENLVSFVGKKLGLSSNQTYGDTKYSINAILVSCISRNMLNKIILYSKTKNISEFPTPWENFRNDINNIPPIFVSRSPKRKITGSAHDETLRRGIASGNGYKCISKTDIKKLKLNSNGEIDSYYEKAKQSDKALYNALKEKLAENGGDAKSAFVLPFYKKNKEGNFENIVKKVKLESYARLPIKLKNKAIATNGTIIRIDVFKIENEGYYLVPIYVSDTVINKLPNKACISQKAYKDWPVMDDKYFIFSLYPRDLVYLKFRAPINFHSNNTSSEIMIVDEILAYYIRTDISSASLTLINHDNTYCAKGIGIKNLLELKKYEIDILGNYHEVKIPQKRMEFNLNYKHKS